jgi:hypothetical protein
VKLEPDPIMVRQPVRLQRGQRVVIDAGRGATLELTRFASGAVQLRQLQGETRHVMRAWSPKEARG